MMKIGSKKKKVGLSKRCRFFLMCDLIATQDTELSNIFFLDLGCNAKKNEKIK